MRLGINAEKTVESSTGVGNYALNLARALLAIEHPHRLHLYFFHENPGRREQLGDPKGKAVIRASEKRYRQNARRILWEQRSLPLLARGDALDLLHFVDHTLCLLETPCPMVVTVHDLAFYKHPEMYEPARRIYKGIVARPSVKKARRVIAVSEHTKREILEFVGIPEDRIDVISYGLNPIFRKIADIESLELFRREHNLPLEFILFVGAFQPRKNIRTLLKSYSLIRSKTRMPLVLCGQREWKWRATEALIRDLGLGNDLILLNPLPNDTLPLLYNLASLFVFPSWHEGFGLPPLEAMACGTPVVSSNAAGLPEVVGDAGMLVRPDDADGFADAMLMALFDDRKRKEMIESGLRRSAGFSWEQNALRTLETYEKALVS